jgi:hypothetical protein
MGLTTAAALGIPLFEACVMFVILAYAYAAGVVPAALTGLVDSYLARKVSRSRRVILTAAAGYFLSILVGLTLLNRRLSIEAIILFAVYGAIAAAVCAAVAEPVTGIEKKKQFRFALAARIPLRQTYLIIVRPPPVIILCPPSLKTTL